jgi:hypothetical protein
LWSLLRAAVVELFKFACENLPRRRHSGPGHAVYATAFARRVRLAGGAFSQRTVGRPRGGGSTAAQVVRSLDTTEVPLVRGHPESGPSDEGKITG